MATAIAPRPAKFKPAVNLPQIIAISTLPGRMVPSEFGPSEVVFTLTDGRPWYVPQVIADEIYAARIEPRQQIEVTATGRKSTEVRIVPIQTALASRPPERDYTPELTRSIENAQAARRPATSATTVHAEGALSSNSMRFMSAYKDAVDALIETKAYANSRGLVLDIRCEDVRCLAATMMIQQSKDAGGR